MKKNVTIGTGALRAGLRQPARRAARVCRACRVGLLAALCAPLAMAQLAHAQSSPTVANSEVGDSAHAWLALQRSNAQAAPPQPMLGAEAGRAYRRYLKSFDTPIPASLGSTVGSSGGGAGQTGSGGAMAGGGTN